MEYVNAWTDIHDMSVKMWDMCPTGHDCPEAGPPDGRGNTFGSEGCCRLGITPVRSSRLAKVSGVGQQKTNTLCTTATAAHADTP